MRTTVCLFYEPKVIALAALNLASYFYQIKLSNIPNDLPWYKTFGEDIEFPVIEEVTNHIIQLYKKFPFL